MFRTRGTCGTDPSIIYPHGPFLSERFATFLVLRGSNLDPDGTVDYGIVSGAATDVANEFGDETQAK